MNRFHRSLLCFVVVLCTGSVLQAQTTGTTTGTTTTTASTTGVLIYEVNFEHLAGFNIDFWEGGFVVLPGTGGTGTVVLKGKSNFGGKIFRQFASSAYFFQAKRKDGKSSVIQMTGGSIGTTSPLVAMQAFGDFMKASGGQPPLSLEQLRSHFPDSVDSSLLNRYQLVPAPIGTQLGSPIILSEKAPVDLEYDTEFKIGPTGWSSVGIGMGYLHKVK